MSEFTIGEHIYRCGKWNAFEQNAIARRLLGVAGAMRDVVTMMSEGKDPFAALGPLADALRQLSDEDCNFIYKEALRITERKKAQDTGWSNVWNKGAGVVQFADMDNLGTFLAIAKAAIEANLGNFFQGSPLS